jgi:hypothetical protein
MVSFVSWITAYQVFVPYRYSRIPPIHSGTDLVSCTLRIANMELIAHLPFMILDYAESSFFRVAGIQNSV